MDGNGRWAEARGLPRHAGHKEGVRPVRMCIEECARRGDRRADPVCLLERELATAGHRSRQSHGAVPRCARPRGRGAARNGVRLRFIGDRQTLSVRLQARMAASEQLTSRQHGSAAAGGGELRRSLGHPAGRPAAGGAGGQWRAASRGHRRAALRARARARRRGRSGPVHPHRRRAPHQQFPAVESRLHRAAFLPTSLWPDFDAPAFRGGARASPPRERRYGLTGEQLRDKTREAAGGA